MIIHDTPSVALQIMPKRIKRIKERRRKVSAMKQSGVGEGGRGKIMQGVGGRESVN